MYRSLALLALVALLSVGTAGCTSFETPRHDARFGEISANYRASIQNYFQNRLYYPPDARMQIGNPRKAYMNAGIFRKGEILWLGYIVDVHVQTVSRGLRETSHYVVRLRDDKVVDVHPASNTPRLHEM